MRFFILQRSWGAMVMIHSDFEGQKGVEISEHDLPPEVNHVQYSFSVLQYSFSVLHMIYLRGKSCSENANPLEASGRLQIAVYHHHGTPRGLETKNTKEK